MKRCRFPRVSILIGILLSGCTTSEKIATTFAVVGKLHTAPLPNYVKPNHGTPVKQVVAASEPFISVHLVTNGQNQQYIEYWITDSSGRPGCKHPTVCKTNESQTSSLFKATFPTGADIKLIPTKDGEVRIEGTATDGKCYVWKSDCNLYSTSIMDDDDVIWHSKRCK
jgi:hypothetical protein